jgi:beta-glucanase (GH16 family)
MSVTPVTQTTAHGGTVAQNADGSFIYTPATNFSGADSFNYTLKDSAGLSAVGTAALAVNGSNLPPVAHADSFTGTQSHIITGNVMTNDTDPNGLAMSVVPTTLTTAHGSVAESTDGSFTYTPATGYMGTDSFNYTLQDTSGLTATGTATVSLGLPAGYSLVFAPSFSTLSLESSSNPNGTWDTIYPWATSGSANFSGRTLSSNNEAEYYSDPSVGVNPFSVNNGVLTITAAPATAAMLTTEAAANNGATLPYTSGLLTTDTSFAQTYGLYEITAKMPTGQGLWPALWMLPTSMAWPPEIDILEEIGNQPTTDYMTLHTGTSNTAIGTTTQVAMTTGFHTYAVDWEPTTITFYVDGKQISQSATPADMHQPMYMLMNLAVGGTGSWPGAPNSSTVFPAQMQISSVQVYASPNTIADFNKVGVQTTVTTPPPANQPPVANPDSFTGAENKTITGNVITNDTDPNGLALSVTAATITTAHGGTVVQNANGTFTYTPAANFTGTDTYSYTLKDSAGISSNGAVTLKVNAPANLPPVANPDSFTGQQNHAITGNVMTNDTDPNGLALSVAPGTFATTHGGILLINAAGSFTYTPATGFAGTDTVYYTLGDSAGLKSSGLVTLNVNASQTPPVAVPDSFTGQQNHAITGNVMTNDTDPNGLALSVAAATLTTAHGAAVIENIDGTFTYNPAANFTGADSFNYALKDSAGLSSTGTVNITVNAPTADLTIPAAVVQALHGVVPVPTMIGTSGNDYLDGVHGSFNNVILGLAGNDTLMGHDGKDILIGGSGNDKLSGYWGNDILYSGGGNSKLDGGPGDDILISCSGQNTLTGGAGKDVFVFVEQKALNIHDIIADFSPLEDKLDIHALLGSAGTANLATTPTGKTGLYVDPDGAGSAPSYLVTTFEGTSTVTTHTILHDILV